MSPEVETARVKMEDKRVRRNDKEAVPRKRQKTEDMINTKTGGAYIPPARLRMMQAQITDKSSAAYQRLAWEALKKSIHGHINKINVGNIGVIIKELLKENIVRGRGLLCRSIIQAQAASPTFTNVYAALLSAINSRFPNIGELLLKRLVIQFKRGFKRNDKPLCISSASFIAHLVNQKVAHEILALELLTLLVETPSDDSVEVAIAFLKECGQKLLEVSSKGVNAIFEMLRNILHEGQLDKRVQYMIEVMFQVWKDGFKDHPAVQPELELVPEEEQFTHLMMLDEATDPQDILNVFKFDEKYEENEQKYKGLVKEILGSDAESGNEEEGSGGSGSEGTDESDNEDEKQKDVTIIDNTETNLVALRRTIYLTINSSLDFEECAHKLVKLQLKPGQEIELCNMFLDCCAEQRTYEKFYGLLSQRFCEMNKIYIEPFEGIFKNSYSTAHRLDTNRLRNVSKFFAHLLFTDSISWEVLDCVKLNEEDTTSSSRIYIKILFQELAEYMGLKKLNDRLQDPTLQDAFSGIFPRDNPKNTRFSINFFTSIGLGGLTDQLREHLKQMPKMLPQQLTAINLNSSSSSSSDSSDSSDSLSSSSSDSDTENDETEKNKSKKKSDKNTKTSKLSRKNKRDDDKRTNINKENNVSDDGNEETRHSRHESNKAKDKNNTSNWATEYDSREPRKDRISGDIPHQTCIQRNDNNRRESDMLMRSQRSNRDIEKDIRDVERVLENRRKQEKERTQNTEKENDRKHRDRNWHDKDSNKGNMRKYGESRTDRHNENTSKEDSKKKDDRRAREENKYKEKDRKDASNSKRKENNFERNKRHENYNEERNQRRTRTPEVRNIKDNISEIKKAQDCESQSKSNNRSGDRNRKKENTTNSDHESRLEKYRSDTKEKSRDYSSKKSKRKTDLNHYQDKNSKNKNSREKPEEKVTSESKPKNSGRSKRKELSSSDSSSSSSSSDSDSDESSSDDDGKSKKGQNRHKRTGSSDDKVYSRYYDFDIKTASELKKEDRKK